MAVAPPKAPPRVAPPDLIRVDGAEFLPLATETEEAAIIAADAEIGIPLLMGAIILLGLLYSAKYFIVPLLKLVKIPGSNWFSDAVNAVLGWITSPIKGFFQWVMHEIAVGIDAHSRPVSRAMEAAAHVVHDMSIVTADAIAATATALAKMRKEVIPREINRVVIPIRKRLTSLEIVRKQLDAIAKRYGYANFPTLVKVLTPASQEALEAEKYVRRQGHKSLAGALSVYEASTDSWNKTVIAVRKLGYYTIPDFIRHVDTQIEKVLKPQLQKVQLKVGKIEKLVTENAAGIPVLMALMTPAARANWFKPALPQVCEETADCAGGKIAGAARWNFFKDLLKGLLALTLEGILLAEVCQVAKLAEAVAVEAAPALRELAVVSGGIASIGCGSPGVKLPPPLY